MQKFKIFVFLYSIQILYLFPLYADVLEYTRNGLFKHKATITNKNDDIMQIFIQCAHYNSRACETILQHGVLTIEQCEPKDCAIIGAVFSIANQDERAMPYLRKACYMGESASCTHLGVVYQNIHNFNEAKGFYDIACEQGDEVACYNLGLLYTNTEMLGNKPLLSIKSFTKSCDALYPKACFNLGVVYATQKNHDMPKARFYFDKACDLGMLQACEALQQLKKMKVAMPPITQRRGLYVHDY